MWVSLLSAKSPYANELTPPCLKIAATVSGRAASVIGGNAPIGIMAEPSSVRSRLGGGSCLASTGFRLEWTLPRFLTPAVNFLAFLAS